MRFQRIVILGNGKIAVDCLYALLDYVDKTQIFVIESQYSPVSLLKKNCEKKQCKVFPCQRGDCCFGAVNRSPNIRYKRE